MLLAQLSWSKFSLDEMEKFVSDWEQGDPQRLESLIQSKIKMIEEEARHLTSVREFLSKFVDSEKKAIHSQRIVFKEVPEIRVLSKRMLGTYSETIGMLINEIFRHIYSQPQQELIRVSGPVIFISHDSEYMETDADIEIDVPITGPIKGTDSIELKKLEGYKMATIVHTGSYDNLGSTYQMIYDYLQENNYQIIAPSREIYLNSPENQPPAQLLTEIQFPIALLDAK
jgi:effector-binding domain-containing protein